MSTALTNTDFARAATELNVEEAAIRAVAEVEAAGAGFLPDGRPAVLYEAHIFHKYSKGAHAHANDHHEIELSSPKWNRSLYGATGAAQHNRYEDARNSTRRSQQGVLMGHVSNPQAELQGVRLRHVASVYRRHVERRRLDASRRLRPLHQNQEARQRPASEKLGELRAPLQRAGLCAKRLRQENGVGLCEMEGERIMTSADPRPSQRSPLASARDGRPNAPSLSLWCAPSSSRARRGR